MTIHPVNQAFDLVLAGAGAVAPKRDAVDLRVVKDVQMKTGSCINDPSEVGGWPNLNAGEAPLDSDHDGMPDAWETQLGLDPRDPDDRNGKTASGYTRIEEYLNSLIPDQFEKAK